MDQNAWLIVRSKQAHESCLASTQACQKLVCSPYKQTAQKILDCRKEKRKQRADPIYNMYNGLFYPAQLLGLTDLGEKKVWRVQK